MNILNLILYSDNIFYDEMYEILSSHNKKFKNVKTIFYKYSSNINDDYQLINDILYIKTTNDETFIPGILEKTVSAFEYVYKYLNINDYDYIIRSNISTIIDFNELNEKLSKNPVKFYGGSCVYNIHELGFGIIDETWFGTLFVSGTSIILTKESLKFIIDNKNKFRYDIIDDVAIGILMKEYAIDIEVQNLNCLYFVPLFIKDGLFKYDIMENIIMNNNYIFYRNRVFVDNTQNRNIDVFQMKHIVNILENKHKNIS